MLHVKKLQVKTSLAFSLGQGLGTQLNLVNTASFHKQNIPCTRRTAGSLVSIERGSRMTTSHSTTELLYSSVAGTCKKNILPLLVANTSELPSSDNSIWLIIQSIVPPVALQLKTAVDPSVAFSDAGVLRKTGYKQIWKFHVSVRWKLWYALNDQCANSNLEPCLYTYWMIDTPLDAALVYTST